MITHYRYSVLKAVRFYSPYMGQDLTATYLAKKLNRTYSSVYCVLSEMLQVGLVSKHINMTLSWFPTEEGIKAMYDYEAYYGEDHE